MFIFFQWIFSDPNYLLSVLFYISLNAMNVFTHLGLCLVRYAQYAQLSTCSVLIPAIINSDTFSEESEEKRVSGNVHCRTSVE